MTENELLISYIEDKIRQTEEQYRICLLYTSDAADE